MYGVADYGSMIADHVRMSAYVEALQKEVKEGSVVLDIGTGTGIFAMLACQFGARKVYAVEPNEAIQVAREMAADNGFADRIEFIEELSTGVNLPERADVIVSDLRGMLPLYDHHLSAVIDARQRMLAAGGVLIPQRDTLWAAVVTAPELYKKYVEAWQEHCFGFNTQAAKRIVLNTWGSGRVEPKQVLTPPQRWAELDYRTINALDAGGELDWTVEQTATAHGIVVWFDTILADGIGFSNAPGGGAKVYGSAFFPWLEPVELKAGERVRVKIKANLVADDYVWSWITSVFADAVDANARKHFQQSTFFGASVSPQGLRKQADNYVPRLNEDGRLARCILDLMGDDLPQGEIARQVAELFPHRFKDWRQALTHVATLSGKYSY